MTKYPEALKNELIARMLPPTNASVAELARETGIPKDTLYCWRLKHRGAVATAAPAGEAGSLSSEEKFAVVVATAALNEHELSAYCRGHGLYPRQVAAWRSHCAQANAAAPSREERERMRAQAHKIQTLESDLRRKEKALAEAAALLVLQKKVQRWWGEDGEPRSTCRSGSK